LIIPKGWALHYNVSYMKYTAILFTILFLQGCTILESKPVQINPPLVVPNEWQAQGRAGVVFDGKSENAGFEVDFKGKNYRLTLTAALGLGQFIVQSNERGFLVNNKLVNANLQQWMMSEFGWHFPVQKLPDILFKHDQKTTNNWAINITRYQTINGISYPKIVRLNHLNQAIKIKLVLGEINQLK